MAPTLDDSAPFFTGNPPSLTDIVTPIRPLELERELANHPDKRFTSNLIYSLTHGFNIGYTGPRTHLVAPNLSSAELHPMVIDESLKKEIDANRIAGPFPSPPIPSLRCAGVGVVEKKSGGWRLINHLSAPFGQAINDKDSFTLRYSTIDDAIAICNLLGPGTLLAKIDLQDAFRICPVRPEDRELLGIHWKEHFYFDKCLPFGLRSSPYLFNLVASAIEWALRYNYDVKWLVRYLDDFLTASPPGSLVCAQFVDAMLLLCSTIGAPVKPSKVVGPTSCIDFLGIVLDTMHMEARLPPEKLDQIYRKLAEFHHKKKCTKREMLSLIGKLAFASKVVPAGRLFLRRLIDTAHTVEKLNHHIHLNSEARADLTWWEEFLPTWNGKSLFLESTWSTPEVTHLYTDAAGLEPITKEGGLVGHGQRNSTRSPLYGKNSSQSS